MEANLKAQVEPIWDKEPLQLVSVYVFAKGMTFSINFIGW